MRELQKFINYNEVPQLKRKRYKNMFNNIAPIREKYVSSDVKWTISTSDKMWVKKEPIKIYDVTDAEIETIKERVKTYIIADKNTRYQIMDEHPWGGCFNEAGWYAMRFLTDEQKEQVVGGLYSAGEDSLNFTAGRTPIGASDFALKHYTYDETASDYALNNFTVARDDEYLIPYIKTALKFVPDMQIFAMPWTPPSWMKTNNQLTSCYSASKMEASEENFKTYAEYFVKYLEEYAKRGICIHALAPQNEPTMKTAYPSCLWTGEQLNIFLRDYLCNAVDKYNKNNGADTEVWLGTFTDAQKSLVMPALEDSVTVKKLGAICFQWWSSPLAAQVHKIMPELKLVQSETKCGNGLNDWQYAEEQFDCFKEFLDAGASQYFLWNMILDADGTNNALKDLWAQNAAITVDGTTVTKNPSYYLTKHFSNNIHAGATRIKIEGAELGEGAAAEYIQDLRAIGFQNADGEIVINVKNSTASSKTVTFIVNNQVFDADIPKHSINTFKLD